MKKKSILQHYNDFIESDSFKLNHGGIKQVEKCYKQAIHEFVLWYHRVVEKFNIKSGDSEVEE